VAFDKLDADVNTKSGIIIGVGVTDIPSPPAPTPVPNPTIMTAVAGMVRAKHPINIIKIILNIIIYIT